jgi:hypothetical protein
MRQSAGTPDQARALRPTRGILIWPVYCCSSGNGMSVRPRSSSSPCDRLWEVVLLQCFQGDCKHANGRGRLGVAGIRRGSGRRCSQNAEHISSRQLSSASGGGSQSCRCALGSCQSTMTFYFVVSSFRRKWPLPPSRKRLRGKKVTGRDVSYIESRARCLWSIPV